MKRTTIAVLLSIAAADAAASGAYALGGVTDGPGGPSFHAGAGYRLNQFLAAEATYARLGDLRDAFGATAAGSLRESWKSDGGLGVAAVASVPMGGGLSLLARAGAHRTRGEYRATAVATDSAGQVLSITETRESGSAWVPVLGAGLALDVGERVQARVIVERHRWKSEMFGGNGPGSTRAVSFSAALAF